METLQRPDDTRWSSHCNSVGCLLKLLKAAFLGLKDIANTRRSCSLASGHTKDFVFIMDVMKELMGIADLLHKKIQQKYQKL